MAFNLTMRTDPLSTALDRAALAAGYRDGPSFNAAVAAAEWAALDPDTKAAVLERAQADEMNAQWDHMVDIQQLRDWRPRKNLSEAPVVPWTAEEKAAERRWFQTR